MGSISPTEFVANYWCVSVLLVLAAFGAVILIWALV